MKFRLMDGVSGEPVNTLYPNLSAEFGAGYCSLYTCARHANVTQELMQAIFEGGAEISASELSSLGRLFNFDSYLRCSFGYLISPNLSCISIETNKGKARLRVLYDAIQSTVIPQGKQSAWYENKLEAAKGSLATLDENGSITYAEYRVAMNYLYSIARATEKERRRGSNRQLDT